MRRVIVMATVVNYSLIQGTYSPKSKCPTNLQVGFRCVAGGSAELSVAVGSDSEEEGRVVFGSKVFGALGELQDFRNFAHSRDERRDPYMGHRVCGSWVCGLGV